MDLEHEKRLSKVEARAESNSHRLDDMEKRQDDLEVLASSVSVLAAREERVESDVKEIKADVKTLAAKPAKKWESMEEKVLMTLMGAIVTYFLFKLGIVV